MSDAAALPRLDDEAFFVLVPRHLDGITTPEEDASLAAELRASDGRRAQFVSMCRLHGALAEAFAPQRARAAVQHAVKVTTRRLKPVAARRSRSLALAWATAAMLALGAAVGYALLRTDDGAVAQGRRNEVGAAIVALRGAVTVHRDGLPLDGIKDRALYAGDIVETGRNAWAALRYADGSVIELNEATRLNLADEGGAKRVTLAAGGLYVAAEAQPEGRPMVLNPGRYDEVRVVGTAFELLRPQAKPTTTVRVTHGTVRFGPAQKAVEVQSERESHAEQGGAASAPAAVAFDQIAPWRRGLVAEADDGAHLDDAARWKRIGELPATISAARAEIDLANDDNCIPKHAGLVLQRGWDLTEGPVSMRLRVAWPKDYSPSFVELYVVPFREPNAKKPDKPDRIFRLSFARLPQGGVPLYEAREVGDLPGKYHIVRGINRPFKIDLEHDMEIVVSQKEAFCRVDGNVVYRGPIMGLSDKVRLGFRAGSRDTPAGSTLTVSNVEIGRSDMVRP